MPLPLIIGAAALASAAFGAKKGYDGYQKHSEADEIVNYSKSLYNESKTIFDDQEKETTRTLEILGAKELEIGKSFHEFERISKDLLQKMNASNKNKLEINIPKHELQKVEQYSYTAIGVLGTITGAGAASATAGFAVYGGVMALGTASTGTAISTLAGAAATKATLAAIGGGSLATGGMGIAGGTAILSAAVAAPALAIAGWAYNSHGEEALRKAHKVRSEVNDSITKLDKATKQLSQTDKYARKILTTLVAIHRQFNPYFETLKKIHNTFERAERQGVDIRDQVKTLNEEIVKIIENGYALAAILVDLISTPIFKPKTVNGVIQKQRNGAPEMMTDSDGYMIVNQKNLDSSLIKAKSNAKDLEVA